MNKKQILKKSKKKSPLARTTSSNSIYKKAVYRAGQHNCVFCPPWENENTITRKAKRGSQKPKYKFYRKSKMALKHLHQD